MSWETGKQRTVIIFFWLSQMQLSTYIRWFLLKLPFFSPFFPPVLHAHTLLGNILVKVTHSKAASSVMACLNLFSSINQLKISQYLPNSLWQSKALLFPPGIASPCSSDIAQHNADPFSSCSFLPQVISNTFFLPLHIRHLCFVLLLHLHWLNSQRCLHTGLTEITLVTFWPI